MGVEKMAFMITAFVASMLFANRMYIGMLLVVPLHFLLRWMTDKDYHFFRIFLRFIDEKDAYSSIPRPEDWQRRPLGWGRGLPW